MTIKPKKNRESEEQEWENPQDPGEPSDARDKEQVVTRQYEEAKRRKKMLTEKDHMNKNLNPNDYVYEKSTKSVTTLKPQ